jgi:hypothetical protein
MRFSDFVDRLRRLLCAVTGHTDSPAGYVRFAAFVECDRCGRLSWAVEPGQGEL